MNTYEYLCRHGNEIRSKYMTKEFMQQLVKVLKVVQTKDIENMSARYINNVRYASPDLEECTEDDIETVYVGISDVFLTEGHSHLPVLCNALPDFVVEYIYAELPDIAQTNKACIKTALENSSMHEHRKVPIAAFIGNLELTSDYLFGCLDQSVWDTTYIYACYAGELAIVKWLVSSGACSKCNNQEALYVAAIRDNAPLIDYLCHIGLNIHAHAEIALISAAEAGNIEATKACIRNGANVNARFGEACINAAYYGHLEVVKILVESGCNMFITGYDALRNATFRGNHDIVKYLNSVGVANTTLVNETAV